MNWSRMRLVESARTFIILSTVFVVVAVIIETVLGRSDSRIATDFMLVTSMVIAIQVYVGNSGLVSFGHVAFFAIAAYVAGLAALSPERLASIAPDVPRWLADMEASLPVAVGLAVIPSPGCRHPWSPRQPSPFSFLYTPWSISGRE
jgi:branched-chain amino acid transport system permease protein